MAAYLSLGMAPSAFESLQCGLVRGDAANAVLRILEWEAMCMRRRVCVFKSDQATAHPRGALRRAQIRARMSAHIERAERWLGIIHVEMAHHWIAADICLRDHRVTLYDSIELDDLFETCTARLSSDMRDLRFSREAPISIQAYRKQVYNLILFLELYQGTIAGMDYIPRAGHEAPAELCHLWTLEMRGHAEMQGEGECGVFSLLLVQRLISCAGSESWRSDITKADAQKARIEWYDTIANANGGLAMLEQCYGNFTPALVLREVVLDHVLCGACHSDDHTAAMSVCSYGDHSDTLKHILYMHAKEHRLVVVVVEKKDRAQLLLLLADAFLVICLTEDIDAYERFMADVLPEVLRVNGGGAMPVTVVCGVRFGVLAEAAATRIFPAMAGSGVEHCCRPWYIQVLSTYRHSANSDTGPAVETRLSRTSGRLGAVEEFLEHPRPDLVYSNDDGAFKLDLQYMSIGFLYRRVCD